MPLLAFLIAPVQRITRYPLLLSKILSHTPTRHPDYTALSECLCKLEVLLDRINTVSALEGERGFSKEKEGERRRGRMAHEG